MKTLVRITSAIFFISVVKTGFAQFSTDMFCLIPHSTISKGRCGFGMNILSHPYNLGYEKDPNHIEVRFGGGFYVSKLNENSVLNVPLEFPQVGNAKVVFDNKIYGCNASTRFSLPYSKKLIPYIDVFAGLRGYSCIMTVYSNDQNGIASQQKNNIDNINEINYGISGGVIASLGKSVKVNVGLTYSDSNCRNEMINVDSAHLESNTVVLNKMVLPSQMLMVKVGLIFCFGNFRKYVSNLEFDSSPGYNPPVYHSPSYPSIIGHSGGSGGSHSGGGGHVSVSVRSSR
ncbi:MAG TPA: hypothetical protein VN026_01460 [Bacteroidia bacterium]|jgi:hypothetical protein|nr:hypothetical protein [Bacteroidia bacterium]